jgi:tetratricopeptide (TPR) repeat protein
MKPRRSQTRPTKTQRQLPTAETGRPAAAESEAVSPSSSKPQRRSTYFEAIAVYERGLDALQRHEYQAASELFSSVLRQYPEEKELLERARLYLNVCQRQATPRESTPQSIEERLYASTLAINGGRYEEAIGHLRLVRDEDPDNDHALYMLAVAHAQLGEPAAALAHLERAIALNSENRGLARYDPDLESLRGDEAFRAVLETPSGSRIERRRSPRTRTAH